MINNIVEGVGGQDMKTEYLELNQCNYQCKTFTFDLQNLLQQRENTHILLKIMNCMLLAVPEVQL